MSDTTKRFVAIHSDDSPANEFEILDTEEIAVAPFGRDPITVWEDIQRLTDMLNDGTADFLFMWMTVDPLDYQTWL